MFIKLQYTSGKYIHECFRMLNAIINDPTITSATILESKFSGYAGDITLGFDSSRSTVIRTNDLTTTKSHYYREAGSAVNRQNFRFTLEFQVPDTSTKTYMQYNTYGAVQSTAICSLDVFDVLSGGTMASSQMGNSVLGATPSAYGTKLLPSGSTYQVNGAARIADVTNGAQDIKTFWAYITDKSFVWCTTLFDDTNTGFGTTFNNSTRFTGPWINSMYSRYDYWNKDSNGIIPFYYTNPSAPGAGYGIAFDFNGIQNSQYTTNTYSGPSARVFNIVDALPKVTTSFPIVTHPYVNTRIGFKSNYNTAHIGQTVGAVTSSTALSYSKSVTMTAGERYPNADLTASTFANIPIGWDNWYQGCHGGNVSEESGVYLFNGDYQPGDTFSVGGKVYMIWPLWYWGFTNRIGLSVPME
jgi:hypothetical protein